MPPDDAELSRRDEWPTEAHWPVQKFIEWIVYIEKCSRKDAFFKLSNAISLRQVHAVDGYNNPLSPYLFPDRLVQELQYAKTWRLPEQRTLILADSLQRRWPQKPSAPKPPPSATVGVVPGGVRPSSKLRKRGSRANKLEQVKEAMRRDIRDGRHTTASLDDALEKNLATDYGVSRDTARKARTAVLSEFVDNPNSRQTATNDK